MHVALKRFIALALASALAMTLGLTSASANWLQWGQNPQHAGIVPDVGQDINKALADTVYDPFVPQEQADTGGDLLVHYQVPLAKEDDVWMAGKTGTWTPDPDFLNPTHWNSQQFFQRRFHWEGNALVTKCTFFTGWKPEPDSPSGPGHWEPVYHAVMANGFVYDPNFGGTISKLNQGDCSEVARINPFGTTIDANTFVASPLSADASGNVYYNLLKLADPKTVDPYSGSDVLGAWLVKVDPQDNVTKVSYADLVPNPPTTCVGQFSYALSPLPPGPVGTGPTAPADPNRLPGSSSCGSQRPGLNVTPAIAPDGTIYTVSRAHFNSRYSFLVAVNPDLTPKWAASMRDRINDGCGVTVPIAAATFPASPTAADIPNFRGRCRFGASSGVDPQTNQRPAGRVIDMSSSSPTVAPDGSVLYGSYTRYNIARGHLFRFSGSGDFIAAYDFGWDSTVAIRPHDGTYSVVIKDNHYDEEAGFYCNTATPVSQGGALTARNISCDFTGIPTGPFYITQLDPNLVPEWKFQNVNTLSCSRKPDGTLSCVSDHPGSFEWCINAPAIDGNGVVYANSEDGNLYAIAQGHTGVFTTAKQRLFLNLAIGAAYTPLSIASQGPGGPGVIYTENDGILFAVGAVGRGGGQSSTRPLQQGQLRFTSRESDPTDEG